MIDNQSARKKVNPDYLKKSAIGTGDRVFKRFFLPIVNYGI
jgi:hypothetical protein